MKVGPAKYCRGGEVKFTHYPANGDFAIMIMADDGSRECVASVCLERQCAHQLNERGVFLKGWSENDGVPASLVSAGIVTLTGETMPTGFCQAELAILTDEAWAELNNQIGPQEWKAIAKARKNPQ